MKAWSPAACTGGPGSWNTLLRQTCSCWMPCELEGKARMHSLGTGHPPRDLRLVICHPCSS